MTLECPGHESTSGPIGNVTYCDGSCQPDVQGDLLNLIIDKLEYDFCEDDDDVQGNWDIRRDGNLVTVQYVPYDVSPYPARTARYRIERLS